MDTPLLRVVRGVPTDEELAALVAVLTSRGAPAQAPPPARSPWGRPVLRGPLPTGPGAWRSSAQPS